MWRNPVWRKWPFWFVLRVPGPLFFHITDALFTRSVGFAAKMLGVTLSGKDHDVRPFEILLTR